MLVNGENVGAVVVSETNEDENCTIATVDKIIGDKE